MAVEDFKVYTQDSGWVSLAQTLPQGTSEGQLLHWDGTQWAAASDGTADGQYLVWNDTAKRWEPGTHVTGNLPISSDDGTVVLDSPSADTFTITTQSTERFRVNQRGMLGVGSPGLNSICMYVANTPTQATGLTGIFSAPKILTADAVEVSALKTQINLEAGVDADFYHHLITGSSTGAGTAATVRGVRIVDTSMSGITKNVAFSTNLAADGLKNYSIETGTAPSRFNGEVQTSTVKGLVDTDAQIDLGADLTLDNKSGIIWLGKAINAPAGNTNLFVGSSDGDGKNLLIGSGQPKTAAEAGSSISFATVAGNGDRPRKTRMFISPDGNVGINNTSPDERLVVGGSIRANRIKGFATNPQLIFESSDAQIKTHDDLSYTPTQPNSIATKQTVDDKIQVMTTAEYNALGANVNPTTLYCLTD